MGCVFSGVTGDGIKTSAHQADSLKSLFNRLQ